MILKLVYYYSINLNFLSRGFNLWNFIRIRTRNVWVNLILIKFRKGIEFLYSFLGEAERISVIFEVQVIEGEFVGDLFIFLRLVKEFVYAELKNVWDNFNGEFFIS
jgi:hypothetical protein